MALFPFKQRTARKFNHRPIYWDPEKERLERRIACVRKKLEEEGKIPPEQVAGSEISEPGEAYDRNLIHETLFSGALHTSRRLGDRADKGDRTNRIVKFLLGLIAAAIIVWILREKFNIFI